MWWLSKNGETRVISGRKTGRIRAKSLAKRITGFSIAGVGGVSFKPSEDERAIIRDLVTVLEDRRALYVGSVWEQPDHVILSILKIRDELTTALKRVDDDSAAKVSLRLMRAACRRFMTETGSSESNHRRSFGDTRDFGTERFMIELGHLRATFGYHLAHLGAVYNIDIEGHLASILPPEADRNVP